MALRECKSILYGVLVGFASGIYPLNGKLPRPIFQTTYPQGNSSTIINNKYTDIDNYKIGYNIKFILNDGTSLDNTFLKPDIFYFAKYFYVYFYDDIHQKDGTMYSHLEEVNDNTLMTSIKLYAVDGIDDVKDIILTAFTYDDEDDFDDNGNYRGSSSYTIEIKRK